MGTQTADTDLYLQAAAALRKAALDENAKAYVLGNEPLFRILKKAADRFLAGEELEELLVTVRKLNGRGFACTTDYMGESIRNEAEANAATEEFLRLCAALDGHGLNSTLSLDLSHIGLTVNSDLAVQNLVRICEAAALTGKEVIISAEGEERISSIHDIYRKVYAMHPNLGITLQVYLHRSEDDLRELIKIPGKIRLVKGAFDVPEHLAMKRGEALTTRYLSFAEQLLSSGHLCSIATHDARIQDAVKKIIALISPAKDRYEFESLLGIENDRLAALKDEGHCTRMYVVYGKDWYLYLLNRIAEYPLNLFQAVIDMVQ